MIVKQYLYMQVPNRLTSVVCQEFLLSNQVVINILLLLFPSYNILYIVMKYLYIINKICEKNIG